MASPMISLVEACSAGSVSKDVEVVPKPETGRPFPECHRIAGTCGLMPGPSNRLDHRPHVGKRLYLLPARSTSRVRPVLAGGLKVGIQGLDEGEERRPISLGYQLARLNHCRHLGCHAVDWTGGTVYSAGFDFK